MSLEPGCRLAGAKTNAGRSAGQLLPNPDGARHPTRLVLPDQELDGVAERQHDRHRATMSSNIEMAQLPCHQSDGGIDELLRLAVWGQQGALGTTACPARAATGPSGRTEGPQPPGAL
jgi:hypothetical protein